MFSRGKLKPRIKPRLGNRILEKRCQEDSPLQSASDIEKPAPQHDVVDNTQEKSSSPVPSPIHPPGNEVHLSRLTEPVGQKSNEKLENSAEAAANNERVCGKHPESTSSSPDDGVRLNTDDETLVTKTTNCDNQSSAGGSQLLATSRGPSDHSCINPSEDVPAPGTDEPTSVPDHVCSKNTDGSNQPEATEKVSTINPGSMKPKARDPITHKPEHRLMMLKKIAPKIRPISTKVDPSPPGGIAESSQKLGVPVGVAERSRSPVRHLEVSELTCSKDSDSGVKNGDASVDNIAVDSLQNISSQKPMPNVPEAIATEFDTKKSGFKPEENKKLLNESDPKCLTTPASSSEPTAADTPQLPGETVGELDPSKREDGGQTTKSKYSCMMLKKIMPKVRPLNSSVKIAEKNNKTIRADKNDENQPVPDITSFDLTGDEENSSAPPNAELNQVKKTPIPYDRQLASRNFVKSIPDKRKMPNPAVPRNSNKSKCDVNDVRIVHALNAVDYLRRHDHALGGNSILRMRITGTRYQLNASCKPTMCASCNPRILQKCLHTIASFNAEDLDAILTRAEERRKTPMAFLGLNGKPTFKPSLGRQRAPTLSASTYGKMSFEVKENLAKKYGSNTPEMSKLRMIDLIFYNPPDHSENEPSNKPTLTSGQSPSENKPPEPQSKFSRIRKSSESDRMGQQKLNQENVDDPSGEPPGVNPPATDTPVPQVKIGDQGQIILAPESLTIKKPKAELSNLPIVEESGMPNPCSKKNFAKRVVWGFEDTLKFYKALHTIGTDFTCMVQMFPDRTRNSLKAKFKREEKRNLALVDKVLAAQGSELNMEDVEKDLAADKALKKICREAKYSTTGNTEPTLRSLGRKRTKRELQIAEREEFLASIPKDKQQQKQDICDPGPSTSGVAKKMKIQTDVRTSTLTSDEEDQPEEESGDSGPASFSLLERKRRAQELMTSADSLSESGEEEENPMKQRKMTLRKTTAPQKDDANTAEPKKNEAGLSKIQKKPMTVKETHPNKEKDGDDSTDPKKNETEMSKAKKNFKKVKDTNPPKKRKARRKKRPVSPVIHKLPVVVSEDESLDDDSDEYYSPLGPRSENCYTIQTSYEIDGLLCSRSIKFDVTNPDGTVDVNDTIQHIDTIQVDNVIPIECDREVEIIETVDESAIVGEQTVDNEQTINEHTDSEVTVDFIVPPSRSGETGVRDTEVKQMVGGGQTDIQEINDFIILPSRENDSDHSVISDADIVPPSIPDAEGDQLNNGKEIVPSSRSEKTGKRDSEVKQMAGGEQTDIQEINDFIILPSTQDDTDSVISDGEIVPPSSETNSVIPDAEGDQLVNWEEIGLKKIDGFIVQPSSAIDPDKKGEETNLNKEKENYGYVSPSTSKIDLDKNNKKLAYLDEVTSYIFFQSSCEIDSDVNANSDAKGTPTFNGGEADLEEIEARPVKEQD